MEQLVISDFKLGIIAGGQLGKMLALAASNWDIKTFILDPDAQCPAASCSSVFVKGNYLNFDDVYNFGKKVDMITFEIENVNIGALKKLKQEGLKIYPNPETLELIKDKGRQKEFYLKHNIPSAFFELYKSKQEIITAIENGELRFPFVQKLRTGGYDGKGVAAIKTNIDVVNLLEGESVIEESINIKKEISIIAARNNHGEIKCFPPVEMEFNPTANLVEKLICPASIEESISTEAMQLVVKIISSLTFCGLLAVEVFVDNQNKVWINEIAPRPHNSGHHTIESAITSQYEQLLRAIFNFPLGSTHLKSPAVMINLLGEQGYEGKVKYEGLTEAMAVEGVKIHLYGKKITKPFRKMGHVTILSHSIEEAMKNAEIVKQKLKIKSW
ncbi:MAG TPA: 5-(carboxyamino)imidazole ribonucleotide synthase [Ignavibacteriaceae bacterium]|nr:5-(carboxyamino)imidazole ribonucleotide synthase [Ignavibacteriaceae bacterium]